MLILFLYLYVSSFKKISPSQMELIMQHRLVFIKHLRVTRRNCAEREQRTKNNEGQGATIQEVQTSYLKFNQNAKTMYVMFVMLKDMIWQLWEVMMVQFYLSLH